MARILSFPAAGTPTHGTPPPAPPATNTSHDRQVWLHLLDTIQVIAGSRQPTIGLRAVAAFADLVVGRDGTDDAEDFL